MPRYSLMPSDFLEIKKMLWNGARQDEIALKFAVTQGYISRIKSGAVYPTVPWPNGEVGGLPSEREYYLRMLRKSPGVNSEEVPDLSPNSRQQEQHRLIAEEVARRIEAEEDQKLLEIIRDHGNEAPDQTEVPESIPIPFDEPRWKIYEQVEADNPLVKEAKEGDECQKIAVITTFDGLDEEKWNSPLARTHYEAHLRTIRQLKKGSP